MRKSNIVNLDHETPGIGLKIFKKYLKFHHLAATIQNPVGLNGWDPKSNRSKIPSLFFEGLYVAQLFQGDSSC